MSTLISCSGQTNVRWAKEKLIELDPIERFLSYEIVDNNLGFESWVAIMQISPVDGDEEVGPRSDGCLLETGSRLEF